LKNLLNQLTSSTGRQGGKVKLPGDVNAIWLSNGGGNHASLQMDIAWDCPVQGSGVTRYALHTSLPDPGVEASGDVLASLVGRFSCY
jgi:hypothetical protein